MVTYTRVHDPQIKSVYVAEVLADLPEWFGLPDSTKAYIQEAQALPLWAAHVGQEVVGFVTLTHSSEDCADIHCLGVKKAYHGQSIGQHLMHLLEDHASETYSYIQVKTVDEGKYEAYDHTNVFYKKLGYKKLEVFPKLWDEWNPCLIWIKKLP